LDSVCCL